MMWINNHDVVAECVSDRRDRVRRTRGLRLVRGDRPE